MKNSEYKQNAYYMLYLVRCLLHNKIPSKEKIKKNDLSKLYEVAKGHSLTVITAYALNLAGVEDTQFKEAKNKSVRKSLYFEIERASVLSELEKAEIWYMPLKGIILKDYYPKSIMREMCDNDILFDNSKIEDVKRIMISLGFNMEHDDYGHVLAFFKKPYLCCFVQCLMGQICGIRIIP